MPVPRMLRVLPPAAAFLLAACSDSTPTTMPGAAGAVPASPLVASVSPAEGAAAGQALVLVGSNLTAGSVAGVKVDGQVLPVAAATPKGVAFTVPFGMTPGVVSVAVQYAGGGVSNSVQATVKAPPTPTMTPAAFSQAVADGFSQLSAGTKSGFTALESDGLLTPEAADRFRASLAESDKILAALPAVMAGLSPQAQVSLQQLFESGGLLGVMKAMSGRALSQEAELLTLAGDGKSDFARHHGLFKLDLLSSLIARFLDALKSGKWAVISGGFTATSLGGGVAVDIDKTIAMIQAAATVVKRVIDMATPSDLSSVKLTGKLELLVGETAPGTFKGAFAAETGVVSGTLATVIDDLATLDAARFADTGNFGARVYGSDVRDFANTLAAEAKAALLAAGVDVSAGVTDGLSSDYRPTASDVTLDMSVYKSDFYALVEHFYPMFRAEVLKDLFTRAGVLNMSRFTSFNAVSIQTPAALSFSFTDLTFTGRAAASTVVTASAYRFTDASLSSTTGPPGTTNATADRPTVKITAPASGSADITAPSGTSITKTTSDTTSISLDKWGAATDYVTPQSKLVYRVYVNAGDIASPTSIAPVATTAAAASSYLFTGLTADTAYTVAVVAVDQAGNVESFTAGNKKSVRTEIDSGPGPVWANGLNGNGQVGDGTTTRRTVPVTVSGLSGVTAVAAGAGFTLALQSDGAVFAWGSNAYGQLGDGTTTDRATPAAVPGLSGVRVIAAGERHALAIDGDGALYAWGWNNAGQIGDGTTANRLSPYKVPGLTGLLGAAAGYEHSVVITGDGALLAWGANKFGRLGDGATVARAAPTAVPGLSGVATVSAGRYHTVALLTDGRVFAWGGNTYGQVGDGTTTDRSSPTAVSGLSNVRAAVAGSFHTAAVRTDGTLYTWGNNGNGRLGDGTTVNRAAPAAVSGLSGVSVAAAGATFTTVVKTSGEVWGFGRNRDGELADGSTTDRTTPAQAKNLKGVRLIAAGNGGMHAVALK